MRGVVRLTLRCTHHHNRESYEQEVKLYYKCYPFITPRSLGVLEGYHTSSVVYTSARSGLEIVMEFRVNDF